MMLTASHSTGPQTSRGTPDLTLRDVCATSTDRIWFRWSGDDRDEWGSSLMDRGARTERMVTMSSVWSIRRSTVDKKLAGVCGGVARHWNVDPVLVRVGWVLLALSGGVGVVLYVAAWLLVPADGATTSTMDDLAKGATRGWPREAWVAIVAIACLITFGIFSSTTTIGFGPAVVLALIWYFGYYKTRVKKSAPRHPR